MRTAQNQNSDYKLYADGRFVIKDYQAKKPFCNFLPGIAGLYGTPMWAFYVNRGQGIASFGTKNKDNAILEFFPANKAYQAVTHLGFRTFVKCRGWKSASGDGFVYEPFGSGSGSAAQREQALEIRSHEFSIQERCPSMGLGTAVTYFTVPGEPLAALARELVLTNISNAPMDIEILDGLPSLNPYGMNEYFTKQMSRTIEAWMMVENMDKKAPFFRLKVDASDRPETVRIRGGNFYFGTLAEKRSESKLLQVLVDPGRVFGFALDFSQPQSFYRQTPFSALDDQVLGNKTPCAFGYAFFRLAAGQSKKIHSFIGQARDPELLNHYVSRARRTDYFDKKRLENEKLTEGIKTPVFTVTASAAYDLYCGQTYLDNVVRGGMPVVLGAADTPQGISGKDGFVFYVYSRKHGDLERDYNRFLIEPAYFAQGDGNYRDVNQNRRNDVWFEPRVKDANIKTFLNLIQLDGFNPLVIRGTEFRFRKSAKSKKILAKYIQEKERAVFQDFLSRSFTLGEFFRLLEEKARLSRASFGSLLTELAPFVSPEEKAEHGEGFWTDHWTYNLDLIESYLAIYPENIKRILLDNREFTFFDSDHRVKDRRERYVLKKGDGVRQFQSVVRDADKARMLEERTQDAYRVRSRGGRGSVYRTTLFAKLLCLFSNKLASLDGSGMGVEMEADKPSWYDALNGLPGLLGSSLPETFELKRLANFMLAAIRELAVKPKDGLLLPIELWNFLRKLDGALARHLSDRRAGRNFHFWDISNTLKEKFRKETAFGISGKEKTVAWAQVRAFLERSLEKTDEGIERAFDPKSGLYPTYFENELVQYKTVPAPSGRGKPSANDHRLPVVRPLRFHSRALPFFLEAPVHALKVEKDPLRRKRLLKAVRDSALYDSKLGMYKVNAPLNGVSHEIGRASVFTPGWLENESVWLHMEYKLMLEMLKSGLCEEFFEDFKKILIPFQPAERYGRNTLENSSFIVSSVFPDLALHGTGFVARLSGSTAEFLNMWLLMNIGKKPFFLGPDGKVVLHFDPHLPAFLFLKEDTTRSFWGPDGAEVKVRVPKDCLAFLFLGKTLVYYHNPKRLDTFGKIRASVRKITLRDKRGGSMEFKGDTVPGPHALRVRDELVPRIDVELG